jgi:hypothetical protein
MNEPEIVVNGFRLNLTQTRAVKFAVARFLDKLEHDDVFRGGLGHELAADYHDGLKVVHAYLTHGDKRK